MIDRNFSARASSSGAVRFAAALGVILMLVLAAGCIQKANSSGDGSTPAKRPNDLTAALLSTTTQPTLEGSSHCERTESFAALRSGLGLFNMQTEVATPAALQEEWTMLIAASDELLDGAPRSIADDLALSQEPLRALGDLYELHEWDALRLAADVDSTSALADAMVALGNDEVMAAEARLAKYQRMNCASRNG